MPSSSSQKFLTLVRDFEGKLDIFTRTGPKRRTPEYKKQKVIEVTEFWNEFQKVCLEIDKAHITQTPDPCYIKEKARVQGLYEKYVQELQSIPDALEKQGNGELTDGQVFYQKQRSKMDALARLIEDVERKIAVGDELTIAYCKVKSKLINDSWQRIQTYDDEAEVDREDIPLEYGVKLQDLEIPMEETLMILQQAMEPNPGSTHTDGLKLPRMTIPTFNGDYFEWISFRDLFKAMVTDNKSLSLAQKMQMLKANVSGEAKTLIKDLAIADINFDSAWNRLMNRFNNKRVVVYKYLTKLMTQPMSKTESKSLKTLLDTTDQILLAVKNMECPVEHWDDWVVLMISQKLSDEVRKDWEKKIGNATELPKWVQLKEFMEEEFRMLEGIEQGQKKQPVQENKTAEKSKSFGIKSYQASIETEKIPCVICQEDHGLFSCGKFKAMETSERWELAKGNKLCFACLRKHKDVLKCDRKKPCKKCDKPHSTWLHEAKKNMTSAVATMIAAVATVDKPNKKQVLLATMLVETMDNYGRRVLLRALLDSGSQGSMITDRAATMLQFEQHSSINYVSGIAGNSGKLKYVNVILTPRFNGNVQLSIECYILKSLTKTLPDSDLNADEWTHLKGLRLADPTFNKVGPIDLLLGTDVVGEILLAGFVKGQKGTPLAQETTFGWIISGNINQTHPRKEIKCWAATGPDDDLHKFWELEELNPKRMLTPDELECEEFYKQNYTRNENGIFTVKIPFKLGQNGTEKLGLSRGQCMARFLQLEKKLLKDENLRTEYVRVMEEYITLGHMKNVDNLNEDRKKYYIPHHAVVKSESLTTKTRVVFDASAKTSTGWSLNDCMHVGAKQQSDLMSVLLKWRKHKYVFKADIEKMYRMIKLDEADQQYHTIFWRNDMTKKISEYQLTTATFGTAAAPFMATRTLNQIAYDCAEEYPMASKTISEDFYVDDLISGADQLGNALQIKQELIETLEKAGMKLRKWTSNSRDILDSLPTDLTEESLQSFEDEESSKALGLQWNPKTDQFSFKIQVPQHAKPLTKREMLSQASKIFDPLGWLAPVVLNPKLMMQEVHDLKIGWDHELPQDISEKWHQFSNKLPALSTITVKRWVEYEESSEIELHGFCDASEKAYAAVVYTRVKKGERVEVRLIASKTRVAPTKTKTTLPRLELCGSVLLANLMTTTQEALDLKGVPMTAWSDSMVALGWLRGDPNRWKTFVANRVSECQSTMVKDWRYFPSEENPADCASRGLLPEELENHPLWWTGPKWLTKDSDAWPKTIIENTEQEQRKISVNVARVERSHFSLPASSWSKTIRITAYLLRWKNKQRFGSKLDFEELDGAKRVLYRQCQQECFEEEIELLKGKQQLPKRSKLLGLNPFLDENGVMRVGGRLENAIITYDNKHPVILPKEHQLTKMIVHQMHLDTLHGGPQLMVNLLRKRYWIIQCKRMATSTYKSCVSCRRFNGNTGQQLMGDLPRDRVTLERAFLHVGVDYAGPIEVRTSRIRNAKIVKGYVAIFVCFGTKAAHLELVSDMTTDAFMAALNRFMARRGLCQTIYSDNGSNFLGTANKLVDQERQWLHSINEELAGSVCNKGINWKFIPPGAPTFGGLWERGVQSMKDHLKRTLNTTRLTFEEYTTVLCQIEACLNSRPLCPLTSDPENLNALTPGHFLIGDALLAQPQPILLDSTANRVNRWKHLQLLQQHFWTRWNTEYLTLLQQRQKWKQDGMSVKIGDIVLVKDERLPPKNWLMGRIINAHPGADSKIRVVTLKTQNGEITRPIGKICPLLREDEAENETDNGEVEDHDQHETEDHDLGPEARQQELAEQISPPIYQQRTAIAGAEATKAKQYNLRPRMSNQILIIAFIGLCLILGGGATEIDSVKVTQFDRHAGLYFEDLGRAEIIRTEWQIWLKFELQPFLQEIERVQTLTDQVKWECKNFGTNESMSYCNEMTGLIQHNIDTILDANELLKYHYTDDQQRKKRAAPLNGVGWIGHEVFGFMAESQAENIEDHFSKVEENANYQALLIRNQTSIVEGTVNLMKSTQAAINSNYEKINEAIDKLTKETNNVDKRLQISAISVLMLGWVNRLEKVQNRILDMLTDLHEGHINSQFFTPAQFKEQLQVINENLPIGNKLPESGRNDIKSLYKIIKGAARVTPNGVLIEIIIPLVSGTEMQVFKIIPIPMKYKGLQIKIKPDSEYLMTSLKRDSFYQVSEMEYRTCLKPKDRMFICQLNPLYSRPSNKSICERQLLAAEKELDPNCKFDTTPEKEVWIPLQDRKKWIFKLESQHTLGIVCGKTIETASIQGMGIVELASGCEINQPGMTIIAESHKQSNGHVNYYPSINLSETAITSGWQHHIKSLNLTIDNTAHMEKILDDIARLNNQSEITTRHHIYHYGIKGGYGLLLILFIIVLWWKRTSITTSIISWYNATQTSNDDVEVGQNGDTINKDSFESITSGTNMNEKNSTVARHEVGECPFRT